MTLTNALAYFAMDYMIGEKSPVVKAPGWGVRRKEIVLKVTDINKRTSFITVVYTLLL
jgi:hypothetical protein